MANRKAAATNDNDDNPIQVIKEGTCPTSSGKSTLTYNIGIDDSGNPWIKVAGNDGGGMFSPEWISIDDIKAAISDWPEDQGITSNTFRRIFRGKSANTPGFLVAVLCAVGLLEPMPDKKRVHQACDPKPFKAEVSLLQGGSSKKPKAKAAPKTTAKTPRKPTAKTTKTKTTTTRKPPATSRKGK